MEAQQGTRGGELAGGTTRGSCRGDSGRAGLSGRPGGHDPGRQGGQAHVEGSQKGVQGARFRQTS